MALSIGIVGLPNVGKSTIFNALTRAQNAEAANYPFCTIEPNQAVVAVPDPRLEQIAEVVKPGATVHATVTFVDIAGLVEGASRGEGLGNQFLASIREADAVLHVVRCFEDENVVHVAGDVDPVRDASVVETELVLADMQTLEKRIHKLSRQARAEKSLRGELAVAEALLAHLDSGKPAALFEDREGEPFRILATEAPLITLKPVIYCANVAEDPAHSAGVAALARHAEERGGGMVAVTAGMEEELLGVSEDERREFLESFGVAEDGLNSVIRAGYETLDLVSFFTTNEKEAHAWEVVRGTHAPQAAGKIHTDFEQGFIRAEVIGWEDFVRMGGEAPCKTAGLMRTEGKDYIVRDGDVILFRFA